MDKYIKIYGERNTNTNYLQKLVELNLEGRGIPGVVPYRIAKLQKIVPGNELIKDLYFFFFYRKNLGWKHACVKPVSALKKCGVVSRNICFLTITKNPYSWLLSLYRRPYHQYQLSGYDFESFLATPWKTVKRENCAKLLRNPVELWNLKNSSYLQLRELNTLHVTVESIFNNPEEIIDKISYQFSISRKSREFKNLEHSTKEPNKNFSYYRDYYLNEKWRDHISKYAIEKINETVDRNLMKYFGYDVLSSR